MGREKDEEWAGRIEEQAALHPVIMRAEVSETTAC